MTIALAGAGGGYGINWVDGRLCVQVASKLIPGCGFCSLRVRFGIPQIWLNEHSSDSFGRGW